MKLKEIRLPDYVTFGRGQERTFRAKDYDLDHNPAGRCFIVRDKKTGQMLVCIDQTGASWTPDEEAVADGRPATPANRKAATAASGGQ